MSQQTLINQKPLLETVEKAHDAFMNKKLWWIFKSYEW